MVDDRELIAHFHSGCNRNPGSEAEILPERHRRAHSEEIEDGPEEER